MKNRVKTVSVTKAYVDAFNRRDLSSIEAMLDGDDSVFTRQSQPTIVGAKAILNRTTKSFNRVDRQGHQLHMVNAIIDIKGVRAHPCMLGILNGERHSVVLLNCKNTGTISSISILLNHDMVSKARPTEPMMVEQVQELHAMRPKLNAEEIQERQRNLKAKAKMLIQRLQDEGQSQELLGKLERLYDDIKELKIQEKDLSMAPVN